VHGCLLCCWHNKWHGDLHASPTEVHSIRQMEAVRCLEHRMTTNVMWTASKQLLCGITASTITYDFNYYYMLTSLDSNKRWILWTSTVVSTHNFSQNVATYIIILAKEYYCLYRCQQVTCWWVSVVKYWVRGRKGERMGKYQNPSFLGTTQFGTNLLK